MAQAEAPAATAVDAVVAFTEYSEYKGYTIIVPKQFSSKDSKLLMKLQVLVIDADAVSGVKRDTIVNTAAWTTEGQPCVHINFRPVTKNNFKLGPIRNTNLVHNDHQNTSNCSLNTTSAICSPSTLTTTTEVREDNLGAITGRRRRNSNEWDDYAARAPEPKRAHTAQTSRPSSESAPIKPKISSTSTVPDREDIIHAPTAEIRNLLPLPASTSKARMMDYLGLNNTTHGLLLVRDYIAVQQSFTD
ncbi:hypothetical protein PtrSN001A_011805, partial [Pyrenophora tritici-repentis]